MVEIYKEPVDLVARIQRGFKAIWLATVLGGLVIYLRVVSGLCVRPPDVAEEPYQKLN